MWNAPAMAASNGPVRVGENQTIQRLFFHWEIQFLLQLEVCEYDKSYVIII